jgi:hypothetical protein
MLDEVIHRHRCFAAPISPNQTTFTRRDRFNVEGVTTVKLVEKGVLPNEREEESADKTPIAVGLTDDSIAKIVQEELKPWPKLIELRRALHLAKLFEIAGSLLPVDFDADPAAQEPVGAPIHGLVQTRTEVRATERIDEGVIYGMELGTIARSMGVANAHELGVQAPGDLARYDSEF